MSFGRQEMFSVLVQQSLESTLTLPHSPTLAHTHTRHNSTNVVELRITGRVNIENNRSIYFNLFYNNVSFHTKHYYNRKLFQSLFVFYHLVTGNFILYIYLFFFSF